MRVCPGTIDASLVDMLFCIKRSMPDAAYPASLAGVSSIKCSSLQPHESLHTGCCVQPAHALNVLPRFINPSVS
jgi:hypothetical protein